jgi:hypothetical protein
MSSVAADQEEIAGVVRAFFAAFTSGPDCPERLERLRRLLLPQAVVVRAGPGDPVATMSRASSRPARRC